MKREVDEISETGGWFLSFAGWYPGCVVVSIAFVFVISWIANCAESDLKRDPEWRASAETESVEWASYAYGTDNVRLLKCRMDGRSTYHCDLSIGQGDQLRKVVTADCDGSKPGHCEACND